MGRLPDDKGVFEDKGLSTALPYWKRERDRLNDINHEAVSNRQPESDPLAPTRGFASGDADEPARAGDRVAAVPGQPNAAMLRAHVDRGMARDKVNVSDPSAAPLGTDDEAAGQGPQSDRVATALRGEIASEAHAPQTSSRWARETWARETWARSWLVPFGIIAVAVVVVSLLGYSVGRSLLGG